MAGRSKAQDVDRHVGAEIRRRREKLRMTQAQLAELIGVTYQQAHKYEAGKNRVAAARLYAIAKALECEVADLFPPLKEDRGLTAMANLLEEVAALSPEAQQSVALLARRLVEKEAADG